ncbi:MAG: glycoside hydrolase family 3 C-terminal domain-containing protein, partial [Lachnospiraceae bacterium]|nr:glycoside hydrolase family 3 C-terminal domain-containing protein [Lachnospiraceae bacterium]
MRREKMKEKFKDIARKLVEQMSVEEAASQLRYDSPAIERLGISAYNWWNEGLHGIARAGTATVFPQAIALAAMFDEECLEEIADVIATETRAKYNESKKYGDRGIYKGITLWSPNVNIFRDARWGRGQETYGEDPFLTSRLGVAFIKGIQGSGEYLKCSACAKHFAAHSGPEAIRHGFDAKVSEKDLEETYLPAFHAAVRDADVTGVMGAYNRVNGEAACASDELIEKRLINKWNFDGYFVSDFLALRDIHEKHKLTEDSIHSAALALNHGCDLNAGVTYRDLMKAYEKGLVSEDRIREAAVRVLTIRAALGMFSDDCEYDSIDISMSDTDASDELAYRAAVNSAVLLKNDGFLPVNKESIKSVAVIGPTADSTVVLEGNYNGLSSRYVTNLEGIRGAVTPGTRVYYSQGCHLFDDRVQNLAEDDDRLSEARAVADAADMVVMFVGLDSTIEGEEGDTGNAFAAGDKPSLFLPDPQRRLFDAVAKSGKPIVLVCNTGSAMADDTMHVSLLPSTRRAATIEQLNADYWRS